MLKASIEAIRNGEGPQFIETQTVRWPGSETNWPVVKAPTTPELAWDTSSVPEDVHDWYANSDPVLRFIRELVDAQAVSKNELTELNETVVKEIAQAVEVAFDSPFPELGDAEKDVFAASQTQRAQR